MSAILGLLQSEVRTLVAALREARSMAQEEARVEEAVARWGKRVRSLDSALKVLRRASWAKLASALIEAPDLPGGLAGSAVAAALQCLSDLAETPTDRLARWLDEIEPELARCAAELLEGSRASDTPVPQPALLALFRQEVEDQCVRVAQWLVRLESERERIDLIAPIMRAAHSIKGAARAVRLDAAVAVAHALEDRLAGAQRQGGPVDEALVEFALACVDLLRALGRHGANAENLARLDALLSPPATPPAATEPVVAETPETAVASPGMPAPERASGMPSYIEASDSDPVLRVKASVVGRLIALAGSGVVSARRLRPFGERQQRVRQSLALLSRSLDELHHRLGAPAQATPVGAQLAAMRRQIADTRAQTQSWIDEFGDYAREAFDLNERVYQAAAMTRLRPFRELVLGYPRMARDLARQLGKRVRLTLVGEALEVDRDVLEQLDAPLTHLLRNAIDHGLETPSARRAAGKPEEGQIRIWAAHRAGMLAVDLSDDGAGIDLEAVRRRAIESGQMSAEAAASFSEQSLRELLFTPGFTTRAAVSEISGRGVGLDAVRVAIERLGGTVRVSSRQGLGTTFQLLVPISRAVTRSLAVRIAGEIYAFPSLRIERVVRVERAAIEHHEGLQYLPAGKRNVGLVPLAELLDLGTTDVRNGSLDIVIVEQQGRAIGFVVDGLIGEFDLATRPLDPRLGRVADLAAMSLLPDGSPVLLFDVDDLYRSALSRERAQLSAPDRDQGASSAKRRRVLVADDSISVRELERQLLSSQGYEVEVAVDGMDAWTRLREQPFDLLVSDVDMPRMDGIELTRSIKQDPRLRALPVIIVSYRDRPEDRRRGLEARADAYLTKSDFQDEGFLRLVRQMIGEAGERP